MDWQAPAWRTRFKYLALLTAVLGYVAIVLGGWVTTSGSGFGCGNNWPDCNGSYLPVFGPDAAALIESTHRWGAGSVGILMWVLLFLAWLTQRRDRRLVLFTTLSFLTLGAQVTVGAGIVLLWGSLDVLVLLHLALASAFFALIVVTAVLAFRAPPSAAPAPVPAPTAAAVPVSATPLEVVRDYAALLKPGILLLLVLSGVTAMVVAGGARITASVFTATVLGGALSGGAASALNHYLERDVDQAMVRTRSRPLAAGRVPASRALAFALVLAAVALLVLWGFVNFLAAALALGGLAFYALVYTTWLKPATPQNIVIGGAAGAFPALVGWAAITQTIALPAAILGLLVFLWTPPHFWSLAVLYREDYRHAGFPMMPVVRSLRETKVQMLLYTAALVAASLLFAPMGVLGAIYLVAAAVLGAVFLGLVAVASQTSKAKPMGRVFHFSIYYLLLLFAAMIADRLLL